MEIERINENTVKFYISYVDIEERGFDREEIWYNREKSEELFWDMMEEIHHEDDFVPDGPLWIQIQALDKGLEVIVTKAQLSRDGLRLELPILEDNANDTPIDERIEDFLDQNFQIKSYENNEETLLHYVIGFSEFEDVLDLSKRKVLTDDVETKLIAYENRYFLIIDFPDKYDDDEIENALSIILEYGQESTYSVHRLMEYGKNVIDQNVFETLRQYFH